MIGHSGDRQHWRLIDLGVIQPVQHVNGTGRRCGKADAEPTGKFGVAGSCHRGCFFVPHVNVADAIGMSTERFNKTVDAISRQSEYDVYTPVD